jgi:PPOX class probable F420-dependent enzyme
MPTTFETLAASRYVSLTTFRRDGSPVATPVWVARDGDALVVVTGAESGKVRRIRANAAVTLAPCDVRGRVHGEAVAARAVVLDASETRRITRLIRRRYGLLGWLFSRGSDAGRVGVSITLA